MTDAHADHDCNLDKVSAAITVVCGCCYNRGANAVGIGTEVLGVNYFILLLSVVAVAVSVAVAAVVGGARAGTGDFCYNCSDVSTAAELSAPETSKLPAQVSGLRDGSSQEFRLRTSSGYRRTPCIKKFAQPWPGSPSRWPEGWQELWGWGFGSHDPGIRLRLGFWGRGKGLSAQCSYATVGAAQGCSLSAAG